MANGRAAPDRAGPPGASLVQRLFGLEVQAPCPPDFQEAGLAPPAEERGGGGGSGKQRPAPSRQSPQGSKGGGAAVPPATTSDVLQYWKYCHLIPAKGLRVAYDNLIDGSFEDMLREAESEELVASRAAGLGTPGGAGGAEGGELVLLRRPRVFTLGIVWESPQAPSDAIRTTVAALRTEVDVGGVFKGVGPGPRHRLRCLVAYCGHHYQAYALSEELGCWLLFDDANIKHIGTWPDVAASIVGGRHQPSLLFYERVE
jgi:hypothetical protein